MSVFSLPDSLLVMVQCCICYSITVLIGSMFLYIEVCNDLQFNSYISIVCS
jgi:hypothetical protein